MNTNAFAHLSEEKKSTILNAGITEFSTHSYSDANTDRITAAGGISKGLLYHYFGTKKDFYLYCLNYVVELLTGYEEPETEGDFYSLLFAEMEKKMRLCAAHPVETHFVNLASRESATEVSAEKNELLGRYAAQLQQRSQSIFAAATTHLRLKEPRDKVAAALLLYSNALMGRYMMQYQNEPDAFFARQTELKVEIKHALDLMLYGICEEE